MNSKFILLTQQFLLEICFPESNSQPWPSIISRAKIFSKAKAFSHSKYFTEEQCCVQKKMNGDSLLLSAGTLYSRQHLFLQNNKEEACSSLSMSNHFNRDFQTVNPKEKAGTPTNRHQTAFRETHARREKEKEPQMQEKVTKKERADIQELRGSVTPAAKGLKEKGRINRHSKSQPETGNTDMQGPEKNTQKPTDKAIPGRGPLSFS